MIRLIASAALALGVASVALSQGQAQPTTLAAHIRKMNWDPNKQGPLLALDAEHVKTSSPDSLASFGRELKVLGSLSAIVPSEMLIVDDQLPEPNLYDGLSREDKVLFLLATLSADELRRGSTDGLAVSDLQGQQQAALRSLMPKQLEYGSYPFGPQSTVLGSVPPGEMGQVKLRVFRSLRFEVPDGKPDTVMDADINLPLLSNGSDQIYRRRKSMDGQATYGVDQEHFVDNKLKPSDLDYRDPSLRASVSLQDCSTLGQLLAQAARSGGKEIYADVRVASLPLTVQGTSAAACDVLKALALAVTGTYRKVGPAYVLTSDLVGMGVRQMRFWRWQNEAHRRAQALKDKWFDEVLERNALDDLGFDSHDPTAPNAHQMDLLGQWDQPQSGDTVPLSDLTPGQQAFLTKFKAQNSNEPLNINKVGVRSEFNFEFVLPDGRPLAPEFHSVRSIHQLLIYKQLRGEGPDNMGQFSLATAAKHPLLINVASQTGLSEILKTARTHGFADLWVETFEPAVLADAVSAGFRVSLVVRPWNANSSLADPDRDVLGEAQGQLGARTGRLLGECTYGPLDPGVPDHWSSLVQLARTPGLVGLVVTDTQPSGYEPKRDSTKTYSTSEKFDGHGSEFGYSTSMRVAFLRTQSVDPIDLSSHQIALDIKIAQPFFPDGSLDMAASFGSNPQISKAYDLWTEFRSRANRAAIEDLLARLSGLSLPVSLGLRLPYADRHPFVGPNQVAAWHDGADLARYVPQVSALSPIDLVPLYYEEWPYLKPTPRAPTSHRLDKRPAPFAIDLSNVAQDQVAKELDLWFVKP